MAKAESACPVHGHPTKRGTCGPCNAAYMRDYMRRRRMELPTKPLFERARKRAKQGSLPFGITPSEIIIPVACPVLGISLLIGGPRSDHSPSLDRIVPALGYVSGNVRVISDRANRLKSNRTLSEIRQLSISGEVSLRGDYGRIADYIRREELLQAVRATVVSPKSFRTNLEGLMCLVDRVFAVGLLG